MRFSPPSAALCYCQDATMHVFLILYVIHQTCAKVIIGCVFIHAVKIEISGNTAPITDLRVFVTPHRVRYKIRSNETLHCFTVP